MLVQIKKVWSGIRRLSGDDAYDRYLQHYVQFHQIDENTQPLSKAEFFKQWQDRHWQGVKRCC